MGNETVYEMETESVKSDQSSRSKRSRGHRERSNHRSLHSHRSTRSSQKSKMAPYQTTATLNSESPRAEVIEVQILPQDDNWGENTTAITGNTSDQSRQSCEDVTMVTLWSRDQDSHGGGGGIGGGGGAGGGVNGGNGGIDIGIGRLTLTSHAAVAITVLICASAYFSPILMIVLPKVGFFPAGMHYYNLGIKHDLTCGVDCTAILISLTFKMIVLTVGVWAVFCRRVQACLPRVYLYKCLILVFVFVVTFTYWLFYFERTNSTAALEENIDYKSLVSFASSLTDSLLFIHYLAVVLIELRHLKPKFYVKVVRSPDGESKSYLIGDLSIQRAAVFLLEKYYTDFSIYNPYLERIPVSSKRKTGSCFKFYDVDNSISGSGGGGVGGGGGGGVGIGITSAGNNNSIGQGQSRIVLAPNLNGGRRRDSSSHNERFYEEHEYERRVKKRRARLITAAEEAFTHIKRLHGEAHPPAHVLDPHEAAQSIFPSIARSLQKYLRATRQQPFYTVDTILQHLAECLSNDLTPRAFLEPFLNPKPVLQSAKEQKPVQTWALVSDELLTRPLADGVRFQLRQHDVSLLCTIKLLPQVHLVEEVVDPKTNKFVLRLNSETSV